MFSLRARRYALTISRRPDVISVATTSSRTIRRVLGVAKLQRQAFTTVGNIPGFYENVS
jgi:hypothetical protein